MSIVILVLIPQHIQSIGSFKLEHLAGYVELPGAVVGDPGQVLRLHADLLERLKIGMKSRESTPPSWLLDGPEKTDVEAKWQSFQSAKRQDNS